MSKVTFVAAAHNEVVETVPFIFSVISQHSDNWELLIYNDGPNPKLRNIVKDVNHPNINYIERETNSGYWGHFNRKHALEELVTTDYLIQCSVQDYYMPYTLALFNKALEHDDFDIVYFDMIHTRPIGGVIKTQLKECEIDWGSFFIKTKFAQQVGIDNPTHAHCDGLFAEKCLTFNPKVHKIDAVLLAHN